MFGLFLILSKDTQRAVFTAACASLSDHWTLISFDAENRTDKHVKPMDFLFRK